MMRSRVPPRRGVCRGRVTALGALPLLLGIAASAPTDAHAQTLLGRVLDQVNETPVDGAIISLVTRDGEERMQTLSDSLGRFTLTPPEAGEYVLVADRIGYTETRSPLLALGVEGSAPIDLMMVPEPIGIEGIEISVEELASEELRIFGLSPRQLGNRWISREKIEAIPVKLDMGAIIERTSVVGTSVLRPENLTPGSDDIGLCVSFSRARTGEGWGRCALIVLNGIPIAGPQALTIDPESIESMAVLKPVEATLFYGTLGGGGAVLVWTRRGR